MSVLPWLAAACIAAAVQVALFARGYLVTRSRYRRPRNWAVPLAIYLGMLVAGVVLFQNWGGSLVGRSGVQFEALAGFGLGFLAVGYHLYSIVRAVRRRANYYMS